MKQIIFATTNELKFSNAYKACLQYNVELIQKPQEIDEIQGEDPEKIALDKAAKAYEILKKPILISDDSWDIPALNGFPGPYMKSMNHWFTAQDFLNLTKSFTDRRIFLHGYIVYKDANQTRLFQQHHEGIILKEERGHHKHPSQKHPSQTIVSMNGDSGQSIAEVYESNNRTNDRAVVAIWTEIATFLNSL